MPSFSRRFVRRRMISLATSVTFMATSFALAQDPKSHAHSWAESDAIEPQFLFDNDLAISNMNREMLAKPTGDVDHDFVDRGQSTWRGPSSNTVTTANSGSWLKRLWTAGCRRSR
jgi:hypothetical protein